MKPARLTRLVLFLTLTLVLLLAAACARWDGSVAFSVTPHDTEDVARINATLDTLHRAAATADEDTYFDLYVPDAVFLGTDATERWTLAEFRAFAAPYFDRDSAWVYTPIERHISVSRHGRFAWFDERLMNDRFGETRGSGVLRKIDGRWRIAQYNLTIPIPNDLADEVVRRIRESTP